MLDSFGAVRFPSKVYPHQLVNASEAKSYLLLSYTLLESILINMKCHLFSIARIWKRNLLCPPFGVVERSFDARSPPIMFRFHQANVFRFRFLSMLHECGDSICFSHPFVCQLSLPFTPPPLPPLSSRYVTHTLHALRNENGFFSLLHHNYIDCLVVCVCAV